MFGLLSETDIAFVDLSFCFEAPRLLLEKSPVEKPRLH